MFHPQFLPGWFIGSLGPGSTCSICWNASPIILSIASASCFSGIWPAHFRPSSLHSQVSIYSRQVGTTTSPDILTVNLSLLSVELDTLGNSTVAVVFIP